MNPSTIEINSNPLNNTTYLAQQQNSSSPILLKQGTLQPGDSVLPDKRLFDSYDFSGSAGQAVVINLESQDFDSYIELRDSKNQKIANSVSLVAKFRNINSVIKITLPRNDTYRVIVTSHNIKVKGKYTLTVSNIDNSGAISSTTPEGCKIILNNKNVDGKPFPDYVEFIARDKISCGHSFTSRVNPGGNGITVIEDTENGSVTHQAENEPGNGIKVTTDYPNGTTETFVGAFTDDGIYRYTYTDVTGKTETNTINIPKNLASNPTGSTVPDSGDSNKTGQATESSYCEVARKFCDVLDKMSLLIAGAEIAIILAAPIAPFLLPLLPGLELFTKTLTIQGVVCAGIVGGIPYLPSYGKAIEKALKFLDPMQPGIFDQAAKKAYDLLAQKAEKQSSLGNQLDALRGKYGPPCKDPCQSEENKNSEKCKQKEGRSNNDPHLATFDGLKYDLQTLGEFILTKSNDRTFEVQARHAPFSSLMTINSAVAVKAGSDRVALYTKDFPDDDTNNPLRVNGKPVTIQGDKLTLKGGGEILKQGSNYVISSPRGEKVLVSPTSFANHSFLNISPFVYNRNGKYSGLLGNVNGNPNDDLQIRGGGNISEIRSTYGDVNKVLNQVGLRLPGALDKAEKVYFDRLYKDFGDSWRVKQEESLFDYPAGKTTENYSDRSFPDKYLTLNMLSPEQIQKAQNACTEAKVTEDLMEGCIFDVGFSGFSEFARATAEINGYVSIVNQLFPGLKIPTTGQFVDQTIQKVKPKVCFLGVCL